MFVCLPFLYDFLCSKHLRLLTVCFGDHVHFEGHLFGVVFTVGLFYCDAAPFFLCNGVSDVGIASLWPFLVALEINVHQWENEGGVC